jgi:hypothetical protein
MTKAEREARRAFRQVDAEKAMTEHEIAQKAFHANRERLKAERRKEISKALQALPAPAPVRFRACRRSGRLRYLIHSQPCAYPVDSPSIRSWSAFF